MLSAQLLKRIDNIIAKLGVINIIDYVRAAVDNMATNSVKALILIQKFNFLIKLTKHINYLR